MTEPVIIESGGRGWSRPRIAFLAISFVAIVALAVWASEVLLPFILATIIAYVLTPLVALCERARIPRALAIVIVYVVTIGTIYMSVAAIAPRIYVEVSKLSRDAPTLVKELTRKWAPRVDTYVGGVLDRVDTADKEPKPPPAPAFEVIKKENGGYEIELRSGVDVVQDGPKRWRIIPKQPDTDEKFSVATLANESMASLGSYLKKNAVELIKFGQLVVSKVARAIFLLFMTLMVAAYLMHTREQILDFFRSLPPPRARGSFDRLIFRIDRGLAGVVRGQLVICGVNGVLSAIGFWMFGLKYWPILAIIAAVMSIVPIFGSILSSVPVVIIGLTQDFWTALWVLLWIIGIHQVEANLLNPKIIGVAAKIHPVLVVFALIVGEHFYGLWGALLAVPVLSLAQSVFQHFRYESMPDTGPDSLPPPPVVTKA